MTDIGAEFVLLTVGGGQASGSQLQTRRVGQDLPAVCYVARDADGERHFLVAADAPTFAADAGSQGVTLSPRTLVVNGIETLFADLHCRITDLDLVFERLVEDVLTRLEREPERRPEVVCRLTLADWRALLKSAGSVLTRDTVIGLAGELEILSRMSTEPADALTAWVGPTGAVHDFSLRGRDLEVKSTSSVDGNFVQISNLDQMDPVGTSAMHLAVVHFREDTAGMSLDDRVRSLLDVGYPRDELLERVADAGYVFESGSDDGLRFSVRSVRVWEVDDMFPGLRRGELGRRAKGVSRVTYELALDAAPRGLAEADGFLNSWVVA